MTADVLDPCPFCDAALAWVADFSALMPAFKVRCPHCAASGPMCDSEAQAREAWNRRAQPRRRPAKLGTAGRNPGPGDDNDEARYAIMLSWISSDSGIEVEEGVFTLTRWIFWEAVYHTSDDPPVPRRRAVLVATLPEGRLYPVLTKDELGVLRRARLDRGLGGASLTGPTGGASIT